MGSARQKLVFYSVFFKFRLRLRNIGQSRVTIVLWERAEMKFGYFKKNSTKFLIFFETRLCLYLIKINVIKIRSGYKINFKTIFPKNFLHFLKFNCQLYSFVVFVPTFAKITDYLSFECFCIQIIFDFFVQLLTEIDFVPMP